MDQQSVNQSGITKRVLPMAVIDILTLICSLEFKNILLKEQLPVTLNTEMHMEVILCSFISASSKISEGSPGKKTPTVVFLNLEDNRISKLRILPGCLIIRCSEQGEAGRCAMVFVGLINVQSCHPIAHRQQLFWSFLQCLAALLMS